MVMPARSASFEQSRQVAASVRIATACAAGDISCGSTQVSTRIIGILFDNITSGQSLFELRHANLIGLAFPFSVLGKLVLPGPNKFSDDLVIHST